MMPVLQEGGLEREVAEATQDKAKDHHQSGSLGQRHEDQVCGDLSLLLAHQGL